MTNNLLKLKKDLKSFAKRCKDFKYTDSALITFLITGALSFIVNNLFSEETDKSVENQKQVISTSIENIHQKVKQTRKENNKLLKKTNLELVQLMEQGDYVVKSPWSNWQQGANEFYNDWKGVYKGRGDKEEKYSYNGIYNRSKDIYERAVNPTSGKYSLLGRSSNLSSASSSQRAGLENNSYGLVGVRPAVEPIVGFEVNAAIYPKQVNKGRISIPAKVANTPAQPDVASFNPTAPTISPITVSTTTVTVTPKTVTKEAPSSSPTAAAINIPSVEPKTVVPPTAPSKPTLPAINPPVLSLQVRSNGNGQNTIALGNGGNNGSIEGVATTGGNFEVTRTGDQWNYTYQNYSGVSPWGSVDTNPWGMSIPINGTWSGKSGSGVSSGQKGFLSMINYNGQASLSNNANFLYTHALENASSDMGEFIHLDVHNFTPYATVRTGLTTAGATGAIAILNDVENNLLVTTKQANGNTYTKDAIHSAFNSGNIIIEGGNASLTNTYTHTYGFKDQLAANTGKVIFQPYKDSSGNVFGGYTGGFIVSNDVSGLTHNIMYNSGTIENWTKNASIFGYDGQSPKPLTTVNKGTLKMYGQDSAGIYIKRSARLNAIFNNPIEFYGDNNVGLYIPQTASGSTVEGDFKVNFGAVGVGNQNFTTATVSGKTAGNNITNMNVNPSGSSTNIEGGFGILSSAPVDLTKHTINIYDKTEGVVGVMPLSNVLISLGTGAITLDSGTTGKGNVGIYVKSDKTGAVKSSGDVVVKNGIGNLAIVAEGSSLPAGATNTVEVNKVTTTNTKNSVIIYASDGAKVKANELNVSGAVVESDASLANKKNTGAVYATGSGTTVVVDRTTAPGVGSENITVTGQAFTDDATKYAGFGLFADNGAIISAKNNSIKVVNGGAGIASVGTGSKIDLTGGSLDYNGTGYAIYSTGNVDLSNATVVLRGSSTGFQQDLSGTPTVTTNSGTSFRVESKDVTLMNLKNVPSQVKLTGLQSSIAALTGGFSVTAGTDPATSAPYAYTLATIDGLNDYRIDKDLDKQLATVPNASTTHPDEYNFTKTIVQRAKVNVDSGKIVTAHLDDNEMKAVGESSVIGLQMSSSQSANSNNETQINLASGSTIDADSTDNKNTSVGLFINYGQVNTDNGSNIKVEQMTTNSPNKSSVGIFAVNGSEVFSKGNTTVGGDNSIGILGLSYRTDKTGTLVINEFGGKTGEGTVNVENTGKVSLDGKNAVGIYVQNNDTKNTTAVHSVKATNKSGGTVELTGNKSIGMEAIDADKITNEGTINVKGDGGVGMFAELTEDTSASPVTSKTSTKSTTITNASTGTINVDDKTTNIRVGIFTKDNRVDILNEGAINVGKNSYGIYGNNVEFKGADSKVNIDEGGVGVYSSIATYPGTAADQKDAAVIIGNNTNFTISKNDSVGVFINNVSANKKIDVTDNGGNFSVGEGSFGYVILGTNNGNNAGEVHFTNTNSGTVTLDKKSTYLYSENDNNKTTIVNNKDITTSKDETYVIYSAGTVTNNGILNLTSGLGNVGIYSIKGGTASNNAKIQVGGSDLTASPKLYGIGMAAGYYDSSAASPATSKSTTGNIINKDKIEVTKDNSLGMYSSNTNSTGLNDSTGIIEVSGKDAVGMFADNNSKMTNKGNINVIASILKAAPGATQQYATAMRASKGSITGASTVSKVINDASGKIKLKGTYNIGIFGDNADAENNGAVITDTDVKNSIGIGGTGSDATITNNGTITLTASGDSQNTGFYLGNKAKGSTTSSSDINLSGDNAIGLYVDGKSEITSYSGKATVNGDGGYGLVLNNNSKVTGGSGKIILKGTSGINSSSSGETVISTTPTLVKRGAAGIAILDNSSKIIGDIDLTADVSGTNSVGVYSKGSVSIDEANVKAYDGAVNFYSNGGSIEIGNSSGISTVVTGTGTKQGSLLFYSDPVNGGSFKLSSRVNASVEGGSTNATRGTAFYYANSGVALGSYVPLNTSAISSWASSTFNNSLGNLYLDMKNDSRLFLTEKIDIDLSNTVATNLFSGLGVANSPHISGTNYRTFMLYHSKLNIDQAVNLDNTSDAYNKVELASSQIINNNTITGTKANQVAMAQENDTTNPVITKLKNNGTINLSGANSTAIYNKAGEIENTSAGKITVGDNSVGIYGINNTDIKNDGKIAIGNSATGIFYSDVFKDQKTGVTTVYNTAKGLTNNGTIETAGNDSVAMTYEPGNIGLNTVTFENKGTVKMTGDRNTAMFAKVSKDKVSYNTINSGTITMGNSASLNNPNVAMYTDSTSDTINPLINSGTITVGNRAIGIFGYEAKNSGNITVGDEGIGIYSQGGNVSLTAGTMKTGGNEAVGVYTVGNNQTVVNTGTKFDVGSGSFGFVNVGSGNSVSSTVSDANLNGDAVYIYSNDNTSSINNTTNIKAVGTSNPGKNYGIYAAGNVLNSGNIDFSNGVGNIGIYSIKGGNARNTGIITVGDSDTTNSLYGIGMAAGYSTTDTGNIINDGTINVNGKNSIGMYASGKESIATNNGNIILNKNGAIGMYVETEAKAVNNGTISTGVSGLLNPVGVVLGKGSTLTNNGSINLNGTGAAGVYLKGGIIANYGTINVSGSGSVQVNDSSNKPTTKTIGGVLITAPSGAQTATITLNGVPQTPTLVTTTQQNKISVDASSIGLYVNTSGVDYTNAINNLGALTSEADLIIGAEAARSTVSKYIQISGNSKILDQYNNVIKTGGVSTWNVYSGSLTWTSTVTLDPSTGAIANVYMAKIPYTEWTSNSKVTPTKVTDTYNFADGLEQRYGVEALGTRENQLFQKLNSIGNNEEILLYQAFDEMMGHQYANVQQRINTTGNLLDKEFKYLKHDWRNPSKQNNKIKAFGIRDEYNTDTAGIIDYTSNAYGVAYVHEDEKIKMGNSSGWYAGAVTNRFKFKDIGRSKEDQTMIKAGIFKTMSPKKDYNGALQWTIGGDVFAGINNMKRRYLVVDDIFQAKSNYNSYGAALKNELGYDIRMSERTHLRPYGALKMEYGRFDSIKEDSGEMRLQVKGNDYFSVKPEAGLEFKYVQPLAVRTNLTVGVTAAYENELGKVGNVNNEAKVRYTNADWFGIRGEKDDRRGSGKFDLNIGVDNTRFGVTVNAGYDTKGNNVRGGIGFRAIY